MAGQFSFGSDYNNSGVGNFRDCKAFGEGVQHRAAGTLISQPVTDNPHEANSEASVAWIAGWDLAEAGKSATVPLATSHLSIAPVGLVAL